MTEETGEWLECVVNNDYEIFTEYPYPIRRKKRDKMIKERIRDNGYCECTLNCKSYLKHRIIAQQFIPNPNNLPQVDHVNHNRADNRIENLRWCSGSENQRNKTGWGDHKYTYIDELSETAESLDAYNGHEFDGLFIDYETQKLYLWNGIKYRELIGTRYKGNIYYQAYDIENKMARLAHKVLFL